MQQSRNLATQQSRNVATQQSRNLVLYLILIGVMIFGILVIFAQWSVVTAIVVLVIQDASLEGCIIIIIVVSSVINLISVLGILVSGEKWPVSCWALEIGKPFPMALDSHGFNQIVPYIFGI
jgi:hypothetical protein